MSYSGKFKDKNNNLHPVTSVLYGTCDTAAATAAKVVTCTDFDTLMTGVTIRVKFANANTAASPTVNINSTGEKSVYRFGSTAPVDGNSWNAGEVVELVYDGTSFFMTGADDIAAKQDVTDNNLDTEAKTIVGAINEHEGDISSLKSGLTNLDNEVNGDATTYPYADVITINDAVPSNLADCSVKIEPVQDLHGQSAPYVGGAYKNKLPLTTAKLKKDNTNGTWNGNVYSYRGIDFTITEDNGGNVIEIDVNGTSNADFVTLSLNNAPITQGSYKLNGISNGSQTRLRFDLEGIGDYKTLSNGELSVDVDTDAEYKFSVSVRTSGTTVNHHKVYPMIRLSTETDATFAPYTNLCPIIGHTDASLERTGKNFCPYDKLGANSDNFVLPSGVYTFSFRLLGTTKYSTSNVRIVGNDTELVTILPSGIPAGTVLSGQFTLTEKTVVNIRHSNMNPDSSGYYEDNIQIELGQTATPYEPYQGKTYTIALGDTVYGGTVDFDSGVMTVTDARVDLGILSYTYDSLNSRFTTSISDIKEKTVRTLDMSCECYGVISDGRSASDVPDGSVYNVGNNNRIAIRDSRYTDPSDLQTALDGLYLVYPIATPFTVQLTPQQIQLLKGQNTLTASTGDISVTVNGVSGSIGSVQEQVNEIAEGITKLHYHKVAESAATGTRADKLASLYTTYNTLPNDVRKSAIILRNNADILHAVNNSGTFSAVYVDTTTLLFMCIKLNPGSYVFNNNGTTTDGSSAENTEVWSLWIIE